MKKIVSLFIALLMVMMLFANISFASEDIQIISLSDEKITVNGSEIPLEDSGLYLSSKMNNGAESENAQKENVEISKIINITEQGEYEFTGTLTDGQIAINANKIDGEVKIILNNCNITCEKAPAIFIYSNNLDEEKFKITIEIKDGTTNTIKGGKIKTSVEGWEDQEKIEYYVEKGNDDDGTYYERYKYDAAISSDVSMIFEGNGILNVVGLEKEGIETKSDLTINSGKILIDSQDDAINACTEGKSDITINDGFVAAIISSEAEEGDGIDSNGSLIINGGTVYAFACPGSDNGLDADSGVQINGGEILSIGGMYEPFSTSNDTKIIQMQLSKNQENGTNIVIANKEGETIFAFELDRTISTLAFSKNDLNQDEEYKVYSNAEITGNKDKYGIYTEIESLNLENATLEENSENMQMMPGKQNNLMEKGTVNSEETEDYKIQGIILITLGIVLLIVIVVINIKAKKKMNLLNLFLGIVIGMVLASGIIALLMKQTQKNEIPSLDETMMQQPREMNEMNMNFEGTRPEEPRQNFNI